MLKKVSLTVIVLLIAVLAGVAALQLTKQGDSPESGKLNVVATFYPLYDFARQVGGDKVRAINMTPAGAEPHDYEPSPKELAQAQESDVFIYNGEQLEPWVDGFLPDYSGVTIKAGHGIELREGDGETAMDPHFWLDPVLAQQIVKNVRDGFVKADPGNRDYYISNAESYNQKLSELDREFASALENCKLDTVISSHQAFAYVADRYNFNVASIAGIEPGVEPSAAKMAELTDLVREKNIRHIFFESLVSPRLANTIADETGADTLVFDPLEGLSQADQNKGRDYISVQRDNLTSLKTALQCD